MQAKDNEVYEAVKHAIDIGYRHFDTAFMYQNETEVGRAIKEKIAAGVVQRKDIFVTTKLWSTYHDPENVVPACKRSLDALDIGYIDLYLIHSPVSLKYTGEHVTPSLVKIEPSDVDYVDTWKAMEKCVQLGYVKSIGVSNFNSKQIQRVLDVAKIKPVNNQVECSLQLQQRKLIEFCKSNNILVTSYCPLARPVPTEKKPAFLFDETIETIAKKYGKSTAQVALRFLIDIGTIPLPKSSNPTRIQENFNVFDFKLTADELKLLEKYETGERCVPFAQGKGTKHYPFDEEF